MPTTPNTITVGPAGTQNISQSETDTVNFVAAGTLSVTGTPLAPINVVLSQVANVAGVATINLSYAHVTFNGAAGLSLGSSFNIGAGGILEFTNITSLAAGTMINFTGANSVLKISTVYSPTLLTGFSGFGPGREIDITSSLVSGVSYTDNSTLNTGGTLTVYGPNGVQLNSLTLTSGEFVTKNFGLTSDGLGGTIIQFASFVTGVTATPSTGIIGTNKTVNLAISMSNPVAIATPAGGRPPSLTLNDGGSAIYNAAASTANRLVFTYVAAVGQNTTGLATREPRSAMPSRRPSAVAASTPPASSAARSASSPSIPSRPRSHPSPPRPAPAL